MIQTVWAGLAWFSWPLLPIFAACLLLLWCAMCALAGRWRATAVLAALTLVAAAPARVGLPVALTNAALVKMPSAGLFPVLRLSVASLGDSSPEWFTPQSGACAAQSPAMVNDIGSCNNTTYGDGNSFRGVLGLNLDAAQWGVVYGGTDPGGTNVADLNAALAYAASIPVGGTGSNNFPRVTCSGHLVGFDVGVVNMTGPLLFESCGLQLIGPDASLVAGDGSTVAKTYYTQKSGVLTAQQWTPPDPYPGSDPLPVGMVNILTSAAFSKVTLKDITIDCNHETGCAGIVNQSALSYFQNVNVLNPTTYAGFMASSWTMTDGNFTQGANDPSGWVAIGLYCAGGHLASGTVDSQTKGTIISNFGINIYADTGCGDFKFEDGHLWSGQTGSSTFGATDGIVNAVFNAAGRYNISGDTFDDGAVVFRTNSTTGALPQGVFNNNIFETSNSTNTGWLVLQCMLTSGTCGDSSSDANPAGLANQQPFPNIVGPNYFPITLEDSNGHYNPLVWSQAIQRQVGQGNNFNSYITPYLNTIVNQSSQTFTGNVANGTFVITGVSVFPALGGAVTDSGSCIAASTTIMDFSYDQGKLYLAGATPPTGNCTSDTITAGGVTFTGNVTSGKYIVALTANIAWLQTGVKLTDTGGCLPVTSTGRHDSWISGYDIHAGVILFTNDVNGTLGPLPSNGTCNSDTFTATPLDYYFQPQDAGTILNVTTASAQLGLPSSLTEGWLVQIAPHVNHASAPTLIPLGTSAAGGNLVMVNFSISTPFVLPDAAGSVDTLTECCGSNGYTIYMGQSSATAPPSATSVGTFVGAPVTSSAFSIDVGTSPGSTLTVTMPGAPRAWNCTAVDETTTSATVFLTKMTGSTATSVTVGNFTTAGASASWANNDQLDFVCNSSS